MKKKNNKFVVRSKKTAKSKNEINNSVLLSKHPQNADKQKLMEILDKIRKLSKTIGCIFVKKNLATAIAL